MDTKVNDSAERDSADLDLVDLGTASAQTKGGFAGHTPDAGYGVQKP